MDPAVRVPFQEGPLLEEESSPDLEELKFHLFSDGTAFRLSQRVKFVNFEKRLGHAKGCPKTNIMLHFWPDKGFKWKRVRLQIKPAQFAREMEKLAEDCPYLHWVSETQAFDTNIKIQALERCVLDTRLMIRFSGEDVTLFVGGDEDTLYALAKSLVQL